LFDFESRIKTRSREAAVAFEITDFRTEHFFLRNTKNFRISHTMSDSESGNGVPLIEPLSRSVSPSNKNSGKRKRDDESHSKKARKKKAFKQKPKDINDDDLDEELGLNLAIGRMDGQLLVDHVAQRTKKFEPELSTVEREDRYLPGTTGNSSL
jgi:U3-containing 90S pre-ribosomal complex subunit